MSTGRSHRLSGVLAAAAAVLVAGGLVAWTLEAPTQSTTDIPGTARPTLPPPGTGSTMAPKLADWEPGAPTRVVIPALDVAAPVLPISTIGDTLVPPADPRELGWWADGAKPGAKTGSALVTGHTVHTGGGALDDLESLERGDAVVVRTQADRIRFAVERVRVYRKGRVAEDAERLFSQEAPGRLVLITCEDWDGSRYLSNVVVTATPVPG